MAYDHNFCMQILIILFMGSHGSQGLALIELGKLCLVSCHNVTLYELC